MREQTNKASNLAPNKQTKLSTCRACMQHCIHRTVRLMHSQRTYHQQCNAYSMVASKQQHIGDLCALLLLLLL